MAPPTAVPEVAGRDEALRLVRDLGYHRREEPFRLASGQLSHDYVDVKLAIDTGARLRVVSAAMLELARAMGLDPTHVGGLTMGADPLAHGIAMVDERLGWFSVRKEPKQRGLSRWIEGARVGPGDRVLLVDDVVTTGGSIQQAYEHVVEAGAAVVGAIPVVDRGDVAGAFFAERGVPFQGLLTYVDLGIQPIGPAS
jgi:orotate phosphoribosyltransferase